MKDAYSDQLPPDKPRPAGTPDRKDGAKLGSLSQAARGKQLNTARNILLFIGILTLIANAVFMAVARQAVKAEIQKEIQQETQKAGGPGAIQFDQAKLQEAEDQAVLLVTLASGVGVALGVLFIIFGLIVKRYPVPVTILALVFYIGSALGFAALDPESLAKGVIIKIIIIVCLVKAVQAALAYEKEERRQLELEQAG